MEILQECFPIESCKKELIRALWRLQYRARKIINTENKNLDDNVITSISFEEEIVSYSNLEYILGKISSNEARYIIIRTVLQMATEKQVSKELKISQQAVSKCKIKTLNCLREILNSLE